MKVKLVVEYFGPAFSGWQLQENAITAQGELERALLVAAEAEAKRLGLEAPERIVSMGSGRTDAGVHALSQVASFDWPFESLPDGFLKMLNGISAHELTIHSVSVTDDDFDARRSPHRKSYSYRFHLGPSAVLKDRCWEVRPELNVVAMAKAARMLVGEHDFQSFRASDCSAAHSVRVLTYSEVTRVSKREILYRVGGNGFLKQMIRIIAGTLYEVGRGRMSVSQFAEVLDAKDRELAGATAPAQGLCLESVKYL